MLQQIPCPPPALLPVRPRRPDVPVCLGAHRPPVCSVCPRNAASATCRAIGSIPGSGLCVEVVRGGGRPHLQPGGWGSLRFQRPVLKIESCGDNFSFLCCAVVVGGGKRKGYLQGSYDTWIQPTGKQWEVESDRSFFLLGSFLLGFFLGFSQKVAVCEVWRN